MPVTPFRSLPKTRFGLMLLPIMAGAFGIGLGLMGWLADPGTFRPQPVENAAGIVREIPEEMKNLSQGGLSHWRVTGYYATHIPEVCWGDNAVNDFQRRQCDEFWNRLGMGAALALLPFALAGVVWFWGFASLRSVYAKAHKRVNVTKPIVGGVVTNPAQAAPDWFSRFYFFRPVAVQAPDGKQYKVYIPLDAPLPTPGVKMVLFEPIDFWGAPRHFGVFYAPHVAVFAGVRQ